MKRMTKKIFIFIIAFITLLCTCTLICPKASSDLDYINLYEVVVDPRTDGTLDIAIHINWKVLDDEEKGTLEWVKIGIPNKYIDELEATTSNIAKIKYYSNNGSFVKIDFDKEYHKDEVVDFAFKFHLSRMYKLNDDSCYYDYNPGWFDEIKIKKAIVRWKQDNVNYINDYNYISDGYYVFEQNNLEHSECIKVKVNYPKSSFVNLDEKMQYSSSWITTKDIIIIACVVLFIIMIIVIVIVATSKNKHTYMHNRGFCGTNIHYFYGVPYYTYNTGVDKKGKVIVNPDSVMYSTGTGSHSSCACACACACAGGGRAGCSRKDFYNTNIQTNKVSKVLKEEINKTDIE